MTVVIDERTGAVLHRLDPDRIEVGSPLPDAICDNRGKLLAPAGHALTGSDIKRMRGHIRRGIYGGEAWPGDIRLVTDPEPTAPDARPADLSRTAPAQRDPAPVNVDAEANSELVPIALDALYVGKTLTHPVFNRHGVLLLAAGMEVTHSFLGRMRQQGVCEVHMPANTVADRYQPTAGRIRIERELDNLVENLRRTELAIAGQRLPRRDVSLARLREEAAEGAERFVRSVDDVAEISSDVMRGRASSVTGASDVLTPFMEMITVDSSLLPIVSCLKQSPGEYLYQHGLNVALLAMSAAARLGVRKEILLEIGLGALLQDVGMLRIDESVRLAARKLTPEERMEVNEHPHYSLDLLQRIEGLGSVSLIVCYQAHERNDGTGYPHHRPRNQIHPYARLVATADVYTAIASQRPHRPGLPPYQAMETVLRETSRSVFDGEVMRNFLDCVSLFPIGSEVKLSTGEQARVIRANPGHYTLPVVVLVDEQGNEGDTEIDLAASQYASVVQALALAGDG
jgi:HD-GYP domain-containing protein (c-di-GMP phosphodiesterase class II)